jgi:hemoglobin
MRHMPFAIDAAGRNRWVALMDRALVEAEIPADAAAVLTPFFHHMASFMINRA